MQILKHWPRHCSTGLGQVCDLDAFVSRRVGDGAAEFEDAVIGAGAQPHYLLTITMVQVHCFSVSP
jgi:hypothetical protein